VAEAVADKTGVPAEPTRPPDTRGGTAPFPAGVFAAGVLALVFILGGLIVIQAYYNIVGAPFSPECREELVRGVDEELVEGARGVCNIVTGLKSPAQTAAIYLAIAFGTVAMVLGFSQYRRMTSKRMREQCISGAVLGIQAVVLAGIVLWFRSGFPYTFTRNFFNVEFLEGTIGGALRSAKNTLVLAFVGELGGIIIGLLLAVLAISHRKVVRAPARAYINFFRGTPLIWQLSFFAFVFLLGFQLNMGAYTVALIVFSLNTGAYAAEVFRAGIQSIERGQMEAARSLGMSYLQAMRYAIVPQAVRRVIPPLMNEFVILIKDTSLIVVLGLAFTEYDLYTFARSGQSSTGNATFFVAAAVGYLVVTLPLIRVVTAIEKRLHSGLTGIVGAGG
jgi:His/Glu/Gln/Arg/opine family amino acid ABC transporter permease subunit